MCCTIGQMHRLLDCKYHRHCHQQMILNGHTDHNWWHAVNVAGATVSGHNRPLFQKRTHMHMHTQTMVTLLLWSTEKLPVCMILILISFYTFMGYTENSLKPASGKIITTQFRAIKMTTNEIMWKILPLTGSLSKHWLSFVCISDGKCLTRFYIK